MINMSKIFSLMVLSILILASFVTIFNVVCASSDVVEDSWNTKEPMSQARAGLGVVAVDGKIYAIGGYTAREYFTPIDMCGTNERYNPKKDTWVTLKPMPTPRTNFAIAAHQGKIYCIGNGPTEVYDIATDRWSVKSDAPFLSTTRFVVLDSPQAIVVDEKIFVIKDWDLFMYDPIKDSWTQKNSIPIPEDNIENVMLGAFLVAMDTKITVYYTYPIMSMVPPIPFNVATMIYDTQTDEWTTGKTPPMMNIAGGCMTTGVFAPVKIYATSTGVGHSVYLSNWVYDPVEDTWANTQNMPTFRYHFGVAIVDDVLYVIGGRAASGILSENEQYVPIGYHGKIGSNFPMDNKILLGTLVGTVVVIVVASTFTVIFQKQRKRKNKPDNTFIIAEYVEYEPHQ